MYEIADIWRKWQMPKELLKMGENENAKEETGVGENQTREIKLSEDI